MRLAMSLSTGLVRMAMFIWSLWTGPVRVAMFLRAGLVRIANLLWIKLLVKLEECFFEPLDDKYEDNPVGLAYIDLVRRKWPVMGVCILCIWEAPIVLILFKSLSAQGCGLTYARPLMDGYGMCLPSSQNNTPGLLKLWDDQESITNRSETPSSYIRTIMTSHLAMHNAELILQDQAGKLRGAFPNDNERQKVMLSLSKSYVLTYQFSRSSRPAFRIR